ncbi:MAG: hypothetical protein KDK24_21340 [Pseudooceanicola sp.]|nr:hypothetical protein [Pseudooceanicola sp.]
MNTFATCTGRLSALMEHQWLLSDPAADATQARRGQMEQLLFSVMDPGTGERVLARRIDAKYAMARLLMRVDFNRDAQDAARAASFVEVQMAACDSLLLS